MVRIAQVVRPAAGGIRRHVSQLVVHLDQRGFACTLFAPPDFRCDPEAPGLLQVPVDIGARTSPFRDLKSILSLSQRLRGRFDLVHAHGLRGALIGVFAARLAKIPAVFTAHNLISSPGMLQQKTVRALGIGAVKTIAVSNAVAESLIACGVPRQRIEVISNGIDLTPFDALASLADRSAPDVPTVGAVGRLSREKGFDVLIEAASILRRQLPSARVLLAGSGPEEPRLREMAGKGTAVTLLGRVDDIHSLLFQVDIVAVPSREEGQGIVALEAMAARKPVVASRVGGLVETVLEHQTGLLVPSGDPEALAAALCSLLKNTEQRRSMGEAGRKRVEAEYTLDRMIDRITELYRTIATAA